MHRTIGAISKRFVQIRPGEGRKVFLTFLYFFLIITAYYVIKPVSRSLVLGELGSRMVPYADLLCALLMGPVVTLFARCVDRIPKPRLVSLSFGVVIGILLLFWGLVRQPWPWIAGAFYVWVAIFSVLVVTLFWLVANDLYHPREAKRLFGFIGSGGILGGVVGSSIAAVGARFLGTEQLIGLSVAILFGCWFVVRALWRSAPELLQERAPDRAARRHDTFLSNLGDFVKLLTRSRYLLLLIAIVAINKIVATLIYYQLNPFIEQAFPDQDIRTSFTGLFFGGINAAAFLIQFFLTSWILRRWGLTAALLALPVGLLGGTTALVFLPTLWLAAGTELYDASMNYSLQQTTKEVLYLPIDRSIRYKVKPFIDMVIFRFGKGVAAVIGIVMLDTLKWPPQALSYLCVPLVIAWLMVALWLRREYVAIIRTLLQVRALPKGALTASSVAPQGATAFGSLTVRPSSSRKFALLRQLMDLERVSSGQLEDLFGGLQRYEGEGDGAQALHTESVERLKAVIWSQDRPMAVRRLAIQLLSRAATQETVDYLFGLVTVEPDAALRQEAVLGLVSLRVHHRRLEFPAPAIRRLIAHEVANYQRIANLTTVGRTHRRERPDEHRVFLELLQVLMEESVEQIFRLLMLLYRPADIHLVYEQLRESDPHLRSDAIELLDNLVDPWMRPVIFPILDEDQFLDRVEGLPGEALEPAEAFQAVQQAIWDHNLWLSVTTLCAVGRLRLTRLRAEVEKATHHQLPLVATAAQIALHLSTQS